MSSTLLKTKTYVPLVRSIRVSRPRLITRLNEGISQKLTLVSAPAGFGKTMLLSEWIAGCGRPVAWVSLDESDNDSTRFWAYVVVALQTVKPNVGEAALLYFQDPQPQPADVFLTALINDIADRMPPFVLVLDDFHAVVSPQINEALEFFLEHMPRQMHLVIAGRADPSISLARLRSRDQLHELRAGDLRFTPEETAVFLNDVMKLKLTDEEITVLSRRTEGWVASLQMAGISLRGQEAAPDFISRFGGSNSYVFDYLTDEILSRLDEDIRSFLLRTSVLKRMTASLCDAVTGRKDSEAVIKRLQAANLFIEALDEERRWYRYHQLFADLLNKQLDRLYPGQASNLHKKASSWFESKGLTEEAIYHASAAGDFENTADLVEKIAPSLIEKSQISAVLALIGKLPGEVVLKRPWLGICNAWGLLLGGQFGKVEAALQAAEMGIAVAAVPADDTAAEFSAIIRGHALAIRSYIIRAKGDLPRSIETSLEADRVLPPGETTARSANSLNLGSAYYMMGEVVEAAKYSEEAYKIASSGSNLYVALVAFCASGGMQMDQGHLNKSGEILQRAVKLGHEWGGGHPLPATATAYNELGHLHYEWNHLDSALGFVEQGIRLSEAAHLWFSEFEGYTTLTRIKQASGEQAAADAAVEKMMTRYPPETTFGIDAAGWKGRLLLARNDLLSLRRWLSANDALLNTPGVPDYRNEMPFLVLARARIALGEVGRLPELLLSLCERAESQGRINNLIEILTIRALALKAADNNEEAILCLNKALFLAEPEGYVRTFVDQGPALKQLLRQALKNSAAKDYIHCLLDAFTSPAPDSASVASQPETDTGGHLNQREQEILRLMAAGLSNPKIAMRLCLSENTIKWHSRNLYGKLGVTGRAEAVNRARNLNLL